MRTDPPFAASHEPLSLDAPGSRTMTSLEETRDRGGAVDPEIGRYLTRLDRPMASGLDGIAAFPLRAWLFLRSQGEAAFLPPTPETTHLRAAPGGLELDLKDALLELDRSGRRGLLLLGPRGAGKTTFLRQTARHLACVAREARVPGSAWIPIVLDFSSSRPESMADPGSWAECAAVPLRRAQFEALCHSHRPLFLIDGLQNAASEAWSALLVGIQTILATLPPARFVVAGCERPCVESMAVHPLFLELQMCSLNWAEAEICLRESAKKPAPTRSPLPPAPSAAPWGRALEQLHQQVRGCPETASMLRTPAAAAVLAQVWTLFHVWPRNPRELADACQEAGAVLHAHGRIAPDALKDWLRRTEDIELEILDASRWEWPPRPCAWNSTGGAMIHVEGGCFQMGADEGDLERWNDEIPRHPVTIRSFRLGAYPVTNADYARFLAEHPEVEIPAHWTDSRFNRPLQPVTGVSWHAARAYALSRGARLPTEAEWEYACRAGSGASRPGPLDDIAWHAANSGGRLPRIGSKPPAANGICDMLGSIWEWVEDDWHPDFSGAPGDGTAWVDEPRGAFKVLRGGSWADLPRAIRCSTRLRGHPGPRIANVGFRLAQTP